MDCCSLSHSMNYLLVLLLIAPVIEVTQSQDYSLSDNSANFEHFGDSGTAANDADAFGNVGWGDIVVPTPSWSPSVPNQESDSNLDEVDSTSSGRSPDIESEVTQASNSVQYQEKIKEGCFCYNMTINPPKVEIGCRCFGESVTHIPSNLSVRMVRL